MCESFFATLECELLDRRRFMSQAEARMACFCFIEGWCNPVRLHSALGYQRRSQMNSPWRQSPRNRNHPSSTTLQSVAAAIPHRHRRVPQVSPLAFARLVTVRARTSGSPGSAVAI